LIAPYGRTLARVRAGRLSFVDTVTGRPTSEAVPTRDEDFVWSPDSRWLLSIGGIGVVTVWDAADGTVAARRRFEGDPVVATFGRDPGVVHVYGGDALHTLTGESLRPANPPVPTGSWRPFALVAHPRDGSVLVLDWDGSFVRVDPTSGDIIAEAPDGVLYGEGQSAMSPDGSRMVVAGPGRRVRLLDVEERTYIDEDSSTPWGESPTFAPDGSQFALVQGDRVRLWDGRTGEYQASLPLPSGTGAFSIAYRRDSTGVIIASTDGRTWTANTRTATWVERACAIAGRNLTDDEWSQYFPSRPYEPTCPQWPSAG
jgi:WD40 repeat protein